MKRKLLSEIELGDRKPSSLLNEMQRLGGLSLSPELLKSLWLQHIPVAMQHCLAVASGSVNELSKLADKIGEIGQPRIVATVSATEDSTTEILKQLVQEVAELKLDRQSRRGQEQSRQKFRSRSRSGCKIWVPAKDGLCFYHTNFKSKAKNCVEPSKQFASFSTNSETQ